MKEWHNCPVCSMITDGRPEFCPNCGEPWTIRCSQCGLTWRFYEGHESCPNCGTRAESYGVSKSKQPIP